MHFYEPRECSFVAEPLPPGWQQSTDLPSQPGGFFFSPNVTLLLRSFMILSIRCIQSLSGLLKPIIGALLNLRYLVWFYFLIFFMCVLSYIIRRSLQGRPLSSVILHQVPRNRKFLRLKASERLKSLLGSYILLSIWNFTYKKESQLINKRN